MPTGAVTFTVHVIVPLDVLHPPDDAVTFAVTDGAAPFTPGGCPFQGWSVGEALRMDLVIAPRAAEGAAVSDAAYGVGYESVPQFTREYRRLFGQPPARDMRHARTQIHAAA